ncbi:MAG TPA: ABC transporter ATP-binding protein [Bryobacteraceae bacterium]|jgi:subfamily B ATP-binding cassette protein MsbA|nr:ABC transporter ATP-binding protein [Bryobacteraceae bacterium]
MLMELVRPRRGKLMLGFLLMLINICMSMILPYAPKIVLDNIIGRHQYNLLTPLVAVVFGATIVQALTSFSLTQVLSMEGQRLIAQLRRQVQEHVGRLPVAYYDANKSGALVSRIMSDVEGVRNLIGTGLTEFAGGILKALVAFVILLKISALMTGFALMFIALFAGVLSKAFQKIRPIFRERGKINAEVQGRLTESLAGVRVVKGYHAEAEEASVFAGGVQRLLDNVLKSLTAISLMSLSATTLLGVVGGAVMYIGTRQMIAHTLTPGGFMTFTMFLAMLVAPMFQVVGIGTQLTEALAGLDRTQEVLHERPENEDPRRTLPVGALTGNVSFENVNFSYEPGKPVLHEISFDSQPGTVTALVGPSGSGKSTIISLISAFHDPTSGTIRVDNTDLSQAQLYSYRTQLGVVLQDTFLFDGTIRENVGFARPGATDAEILEACRIARVDEFAEKFDKKYDTIVGERGVKLSGGQRQRVSIARAILANPRILILDEATSSLDSESEAAIQEGLQYLMKGRTTFVIAHRLSTIRRADQILVVEQGRIVERGTHQSLYDLRGRYWDLYTRQHGVDANLFLAPGEGDKIPEEEEKVRLRGAAPPSAASLFRGGAA